MVNEFEFMGITSERDATICMLSIDKPFSIDGSNKEVILSKLFFPLAYQEGRRLSNYAKDLWEAFEIIKEKYNITINQILMKHFMDTIIYCMKKYGIYGKTLYEPTIKEWVTSIEECGFVLAQI